MRTTLDLPDDLLRAIRIRAAEEQRTLKDLMAELLRRGLARPTDERQAQTVRRVRLPLVRCAHPARPEEEMTPERVAEILAGTEAM